MTAVVLLTSCLPIYSHESIYYQEDSIYAENTVIVCNNNLSDSNQLAADYADMRGIPTDHIIALDIPLNTMSSNYEILNGGYSNFMTYIKTPVFDAIDDLVADEHNILYIVIMYGVPLKAYTTDGIYGSVDNALIVRETNYFVISWYYGVTERFADQTQPHPFYNTRQYIVGRIDGADYTAAKALMDNSYAAEKGLDPYNNLPYWDPSNGNSYYYIDARGLVPNPAGYYTYDQLLISAYNDITSLGYSSILDNVSALFSEVMDAQLYFGWYAGSPTGLFQALRPGAIMIHTYSGSAVTIRNTSSWCGFFLAKENIGATAGAVDEPGLATYCAPDKFCHSLLSHHNNLGEAYLSSSRCANWKMVLIGDPLYNPTSTDDMVPCQ